VALAYFVSLVRGRVRWAEHVRRSNFLLALGICAFALLLATPLVDFGAISTRDQVARLESGKVSPEEFDWAALRFDFGPSGERALQRLSRHSSPPVRAFAAKALQSKERWGLDEEVTANRRANALRQSVRVMPAQVETPEPLRQALARSICSAGDCTLFWQPGQSDAVAVGFGCRGCLASVTHFRLSPTGGWEGRSVDSSPLPHPAPDETSAVAEAQRGAVSSGRVEVKEVVRRQVFIDGKPVAAPF